jgi:dihydrodipicolinate synthase/N-acetylneuraminate lyase
LFDAGGETAAPPLAPHGFRSLDEAALRAEARFMVETAWVHGLAVTGSTGEGHVLSTDEVRRITAAVSQGAGLLR